MARLEGAVFQHLSEDGTVTGLVSTRILRVTEEPTTPLRPYIVFERQSTEPTRSGNSGVVLLTNSQIELEVIADNPTSARTVADSVRGRMDNFHGLMGATEQLSVQAVFLEEDRESSRKSNDGSDTFRYVVSQSYSIWY